MMAKTAGSIVMTAVFCLLAGRAVSSGAGVGFGPRQSLGVAEALTAARAVAVPDVPRTIPVVASASGRPAAPPPVSADQISQAQLSADGEKLLYVRWGAAYLLDLNTHSERMLGIAQTAELSRNGRVVLLQSGGSYEVYSLDTAALQSGAAARRSPIADRSVSLSGDGRTVLLGDGGFFTAVGVLTGESHRLGWGATAVISGDGSIALLGARDAFQVVDVATGRTDPLMSRGTTAALSQDGRIALIGDGRTYEVVELPGGRGQRLTQGGNAQLSSDGRIALIGGGGRGSFEVCDTVSVSCRLLAWSGSAKLSEDGRTAVVEENGSVSAYATATGRSEHLAWGALVSLSADGRRVAVRNGAWIEFYDL